MKILSTWIAATSMSCVWLVGPRAALAAAADSGSQAANPLTADPDLAIFTFIIFLLLLGVLYVLAWRPLLAGLDQRERSMADMINSAKRSHEEAARKLEAYERKLAAAAVEAHKVVDQARRDAVAAGEKLLAEARAAADRERARALADIATAKSRAVQDIADQSARLAFTLARRVIQKELRPEDHAALIRETLEQFPSEN